MKKITALIVAVLLALTLGCASSLAESAPSDQEITAKLPEPGWVLDSLNGTSWICDRASLDVFLEDEDNYKVQISWSESAWEASEWVFRCVLEPDTGRLLASQVVCDEVTYGEDGQEENRTCVYEKDSQAVFALDKDGFVVLENPGDESLNGLRFERAENAPEASETSSESNPAALTGWNLPETIAVTDEALQVFEKGAEKLLGVHYEPLGFLGEKDGLYCFLCRATVVYPNAAPYYVLFYVNEDGVQNIWDLWVDAHKAP